MFKFKSVLFGSTLNLDINLISMKHGKILVMFNIE